jgi:hypothetical protein
MMRHFKIALLATGIALLLAIAVGIAVVTSIHRSPASNREKAERAQQAGGAVAIATLVVVTPFWLFAAAKVGRERRETRQRARRGK